MGIKSRGNFKTMSTEQYAKIKWDSEKSSLCNNCGGQLKENDETLYCSKCGTIIVG